MQGYVFNEEIASAYGITNANPQFGKEGCHNILYQMQMIIYKRHFS